MSGRSLYTALALAGTLPFVGAALLLLLDRPSLGPFGSIEELVISYGLAIICFLAGAHWATQLYRGAAAPMNLFIASNVVVLVAWFAYLLGGLAVTVAAQLLTFAFLLYVDHRLLGDAVIDRQYFHVRAAATAVACASLLTVLLAS